MATTQTTMVDCCVVGGGPGGMVLAPLLARQGVRVLVLEARDSFERDFRGDNVHPSTLELMDELGLLERLRALQTAGGADFPVHLPDGSVSPPSRERGPSRFRESLAVPQAAFLELLADAARMYPRFQLKLGARVEQLIEDGGTVRGVRYRTNDGLHEVHAGLVVGADGRFSKVRQLAGIEMAMSHQEADLLWLRLPKADTDPARAYGLYVGRGDLLVISDRGDTWQIGLLIPKSAYAALRAAGIQALRDKVASMVPWLTERTLLLRDWNQTSLLVVQAGRVKRWHRPGLLLIGDAAHVMSPVFGVGINYAIQDAVLASNVLGPRLASAKVRASDLAAVQRRRECPTRQMQFLQEVERYREMGASPPLHMRLAAQLVKLPVLRNLQLRLIKLGGLRAERVREPWQANRPGLVMRAARASLSTLAYADLSGWMSFGGMAWWPGGYGWPFPDRRTDERGAQR